MAKAGGFSRPIAGECPARTMKTRKLYLRSTFAPSTPVEPVDLIVAIGAPAAAFVQRYRQRLFPVTPMVFTAVEQRRVQYDKLTENDTVVAVAHDFPAAFDNILRVLPLTKTIAVVNGASPNETFWQEVMRRELAPLAGRVELRWYNEKSFEDILIDAARLPPHSAIFWHLMNVDAAGVAHEANSASERTLLAPPTCRFSHTTVPSSMEQPSAAPCTQCKS